MENLTLEDAWIKAAVEHRLVTVTYLNPETRLVYTKRDVRPDFVEGQDGGPVLWGVLNHNPHVGVKAFSPRNFQFFQVTGQRFHPDPNGRWKHLVPTYEERKLAEIAL